MKKNIRSKTSIEEEEDIVVPSQKKMFQIILELGNKLNTLEEKMDEINKWVIKKKRKVNIIEWLNINIKPVYEFDKLYDKIVIIEEDIKYLFNNSFIDTLNEIFSRTLYFSDDEKNIKPIFAFIQKTNVFYIYENEEIGWTELSKERLIKFLNNIHMKLFSVFRDWKKTNNMKIKDDECLLSCCDKTTIKIMGVDFKVENLLNKIRLNIYSNLKTDMKAIIEYEFEF
jgi:hypothetical protein